MTGDLYEWIDGCVRVERDGVWGLFSVDGRWIDGELRSADPHMCIWIGAGPAYEGNVNSIFDAPKESYTDDQH